MTQEDEIDIEIAHSILNGRIIVLARRRAEIENEIETLRELQWSLTPASARQIIEERG